MTQPDKTAMLSSPLNLRAPSNRATLALTLVLLLLAAAPAFGVSAAPSNFPGGLLNYQTPVGSGFSGPCGVAVDKAGDVFVADPGAAKVYEIVAVNGAVSASSTVNPIGNRTFNQPCGLAVDASGNVFVTDKGTGGGEVYEIEATNGVVSSSSKVVTIDSFYGPIGLAFDASGNLFVADYDGKTVYEIPATGGVIVINTNAVPVGSGFKGPFSVTVDASGDVFVADNYYAGGYIGNVYEIVAVSGVVSATSTVNQVGSGFILPSGVVLDGFGNLYVSDSFSGKLYAVDGAGGFSSSSLVYTISSSFSYVYGPYGLAMDGNGNIFVADNWGATVYQIATRAVNFGSAAVGVRSAALPLSFIAASGGELGSWSVVNDNASGNAFALASGTTCIRNNTYSKGQSCTIAVNFTPRQAGVSSGALILKDASGTPVITAFLTGTGTAPQISFMPGSQSAALNGTKFGWPDSIAVDAAGNLFIADPWTTSICELAAGSNACYWLGDFNAPEGVAVDGAGNIYVADVGDNNNPAVYLLVPGNGGYSQFTFASDFSAPTGVAVDGSGNVYVADDGAGAIYKLSPNFDYSYVQTTIATGLANPWAVAVDGSGNLFVAGNGTASNPGHVYMLTLTGNEYTVSTLGSGWLDPNAIAVDAAGAIFVADDADSDGKGFVDVLHPTVSGGVTTYAQDTMVSSKQVADPEGIALDQKGNLYVVDGLYGTENAYKFDYADPPSLSFAGTTVGVTSADSPQTVYALNIGNAPLNIAAVGFPASFPQDGSASSDCAAGASLAPATACSLTIDFLPRAAGTNAGVVSLKDNSLNAAAVQQNIHSSGVGAATAAVLGSPVAGATLAAANQTFTWNSVAGATGYTLYLGTTGVGAANLLDAHTAATTVTAANLPTNGQPVYARLWTNFSGVWTYNDYTFTAASPAALTSPTPGTAFTGASVTFTWAPVAGATSYSLYLGTSVGAGNLLDAHTTATTATATNLPANGKPVYARLWTNVNGVWSYNDYTFTAVSPAALTSPAPGTAFTSTSVTFTWNPVAGATSYTLYLGSTGVGAGNLLDAHTTATTVTAANLPANGLPVYARLWTNVNGVWTYNDYTFTAK